MPSASASGSRDGSDNGRSVAFSLLPSKSTIAASSLSGMLARVFLHPLDTLKAKLQVSQVGWRDCIIQTAKTEGFSGFYRGFGITFLGSAPAVTLYLASYDMVKHSLHSVDILKNAQYFSNFASGLSAEFFSCVLWVPIDVVKERLQTQTNLMTILTQKYSKQLTEKGINAQQMQFSQPHLVRKHLLEVTANSTEKIPEFYAGNLDALMKIARTEGFRGVYKGYGATVASFGPFSALYLSGYEEFKALFQRLYLQSKLTSSSSSSSTSSASLSSSSSSSGPVDLPFWLYFVSGGLAGGVASFVTNPLDLAKLRLQVQRRHNAFPFTYRNIVHGLASIWKEEGPKALWKGAAARVAFHLPSSALTIALFDTLKEKFKFLNSST